MASSVVSDNFETGTGAIPNMGGADVTTRLCSAWVNFNGTGTVAIRAAYNVSSITDNAAGNYTVNFAAAMTDVNYNVSMSTTSYSNTNNTTSAVIRGNSAANCTPELKTTTQLKVIMATAAGAGFDAADMNVMIFGG